VCLLPGTYVVSGDINVAGKSLTIQGLGSGPGDVRLVISGSIKLAPAENDTVVVRGITCGGHRYGSGYPGVLVG
jgi:hypothetical protein